MQINSGKNTGRTTNHRPFIEDGRYVMEVPREYQTAKSLLSSEALVSVSLGKHVRQSLELGWTLHEGAECWKEVFAPFIAEFFDQRLATFTDTAGEITTVIPDTFRFNKSDLTSRFQDLFKKIYLDFLLFEIMLMTKILT